MPVVPPPAGDHVIAERVGETTSVLVVRGNVLKIDVRRNAIQLCDGANGGRQTIPHELPHDRVMFVDVIAATADEATADSGVLGSGVLFDIEASSFFENLN